MLRCPPLYNVAQRNNSVTPVPAGCERRSPAPLSPGAAVSPGPSVAGSAQTILSYGPPRTEGGLATAPATHSPAVRPRHPNPAMLRCPPLYNVAQRNISVTPCRAPVNSVARRLCRRAPPVSPGRTRKKGRPRCLPLYSDRANRDCTPTRRWQHLEGIGKSATDKNDHGDRRDGNQGHQEAILTIPWPSSLEVSLASSQSFIEVAVS